MYSSLLPQHSTEFEKAVEKIGAARVLDPELIVRAHDPWLCPVELLPWLAHKRGVDLWFDDWHELTKRRMIDAMPRLLRLKGTLAAIEGYLDILNVPITYTRLPPQDGWYGASITAEERTRWLSKLPQLRLYQRRTSSDVLEGEGYFNDNALYSDESPDDAEHYWGNDIGAFLAGERAFIWRNGIEVPVPLETVAVLEEGRVTTRQIRVAIPDVPGDGLVYGETAYGDGCVLPAGDAERNHVTLSFRQGELVIDTDFVPVGQSYRPQDARFELVHEPSEVLPGEHFFDDDFVFGEGESGCSYYGSDDAELHTYRRVYLIDPTVHVESPEGGFCWDDFMWGLPPLSAIIGIDVSEEADPDHLVYGDTDGCYVATDTQRLDRALEAVRRAQGGSDLIVIDTITFSPLTFGDRKTFGDGVKFGQMIERY
jgi:hypothetical protein